MTKQQFIKDNVMSEFYYFDIVNSNPNEFDKLNDFEMSYLNDHCQIYKTRYMDSEYELHTYIFEDNHLHIKVIEMCDTKGKVLEFYKDGVISKRISYSFEIKNSMEKFDSNERKILYVDFSNMSGYKLKYPSTINNESTHTQSMEAIKSELYYRELEEYL